MIRTANTLRFPVTDSFLPFPLAALTGGLFFFLIKVGKESSTSSDLLLSIWMLSPKTIVVSPETKSPSIKFFLIKASSAEGTWYTFPLGVRHSIEWSARSSPSDENTFLSSGSYWVSTSTAVQLSSNLRRFREECSFVLSCWYEAKGSHISVRQFEGKAGFTYETCRATIRLSLSGQLQHCNDLD